MGRPVVADVMIAVMAGISIAMGAAGAASAQSNLDAGKSPAQLFANGCSGCHRTPQEVAHAGRDFLLEHYTTGPHQADAMAAYLDTVRISPARAAKPRRSPSAEADVVEVDSTGSIAAEPAVATTELPVPLDIDE
jgi:hypothetical protein